MSRVLVTDAEQRSSLAVVRSLGKARHDVVVVSHHARALAAVSRYVRAFYQVPNPGIDSAAFRTAVRRVVEAERPDILLPMTDISIPLLLGFQEEDLGVIIPFSDRSAYERISDKHVLMGAARKLGIPVPAQVVLHRPPPDLSIFRPPLVFKPARSVVRVQGGMRKQVVRIITTVEDVQDALDRYGLEAYPILAQERIVGPGLGFFVLAREGEVLASFAHRRIREKPPTGGVSVYRESVPAAHELMEYAGRLMAHFRWTGVAMVEFKQDASTGKPYLMEVNARFWGSLQLAIDAGVDFPELLLRLATGSRVPPVTAYRIGVRSRWLWGDVDHLLWMLRAPRGFRKTHATLPSRVGALARFLLPWRPGDRFEVMSATDPLPFLRESAEWLRALRR